MRLDLERSGGLTGRTLRWSLDVDALDPAGRDEVHELLAQAPGWTVQGSADAWPRADTGQRTRSAAPGAASRGADRFSYRLVADEPGSSPLEVRLVEPLSEPARRLLTLIRTATA